MYIQRVFQSVSLYAFRALLLSSLFFSALGLFSLGCGKGECRFDADCPKAQICRSGICTKNLTGKKICKSNRDCPQGQFCIGERCVSGECTPGQEMPCYDGPSGTMNIGTCKKGIRICQNGFWSSCLNQVLPEEELCDQRDNDCDGKTDNSPKCKKGCRDGETRECYTGPPGTNFRGICRSGTETCKGGKWSGCVGDITPAPKEICGDRKDNNCDGQIDENCGSCKDGDKLPCYSGPANTRGIGACKDGVKICKNGQWTKCQGEVTPQIERCGDNVDNDCNGKIDELPGCQQKCRDGEQRTCYSGKPGTRNIGACKEGIQICKNGKWGPCQGEITPAPENCNDRLDNNCNGQVNEGCGVCNNGDSEVCYTGTTGCKKQPDGSYRCNGNCRSGIRTCQNGQWGPCLGQILPSKEKCGDNVDNDCDGNIDNGCGVCKPGDQKYCYDGPPNTAGKGICRKGFKLCQNGQWTKCLNQVIPTAEKCGDNLDNDCDGQTDEGCTFANPKLHQPCTTQADCGNGLICIPITQQQSICLQNCTGAPNICTNNTDGRTNCVEIGKNFQGKVFSICAKLSSVGASCDLKKSILCPASTSYCLNNQCVSAQTVGLGQKCTSTPPLQLCDWKQNLLCVSVTPQATYCLRYCTNNIPCPAGFSCTSTTNPNVGICLKRCTTNTECLGLGSNYGCSANGYCLPGISGNSGGGNTGSKFGTTCQYSVTNPYCSGGALVCLRTSFTSYNGFCTKINCITDSDCPTYPGYNVKCLTVRGTDNTTANFCFIICNGQTCPTGFNCKVYNSSINFCLVP